MKPRKLAVVLLCAILYGMLAGPARATTKGLNQIVTPDVQPLGQVSLSLQAQHPAIGNSLQFQVEAGLTRNFEVAVFYGMRPGLLVLNTEWGLVQRKHTLLSVGFSNWNAKGSAPQPFIEGGYYRGRYKLMAGIVEARTKTEYILGLGYQASPDLLLQLDWQSGVENYATAGFTVNFTPALSLNPAIYRANSPDHSLYGYAVLTWNFTGWK